MSSPHFVYKGFNKLKGLVYVFDSVTKQRVSIPYSDFNKHPACKDMACADNFDLGREVGVYESKLGVKYDVDKTWEREPKYRIFLVVLYSLLFFLSNITAVKIVPLFEVSFFGTAFQLMVPAAIFIYSISFFIDDLITEVYGINATVNAIKIAILVNFIGVALLIGLSFISGINDYDPIKTIIFGENGVTIRAFIFSFLSFGISNFINGYILSKLKMKDYSIGSSNSLIARYIEKIFIDIKLIRRFVLSTFVGAFIDSFIFCFGVFLFTGLSVSQIAVMALTQYIIKLLYEFVGCSLITAPLCSFLKNKEKIDVISDIKITSKGVDIQDKDYYAKL